MSKVIHIHLHKATKDTLQGGSSKAAFSHNVKTEVAAGKPVKQAVAIAYSKKRETNDNTEHDPKNGQFTSGGGSGAGKSSNVKQLTKFKQPAAQKHDTAARQHAQAAAHHESQGNEKLAHTYNALSEAHKQAARHHEAGNAEQAKKAEQLVATHKAKLKA